MDLARTLLEARSKPEVLRASFKKLDAKGRLALLDEAVGPLSRQIFEFGKPTSAFAPDSLLPDRGAAGKVQVYTGRTSFGVLGDFELHFYRGKDGKSVFGRVVIHSGSIGGPAYFTARKGDRSSPVVLDFTKVPEAGDHPEGWPAVEPNDLGLGAIVWRQLEIRLKDVGEGVISGSIHKRGDPLHVHVTMVRERRLVLRPVGPVGPLRPVRPRRPIG